eukprot:scaffold87066_cov20-Tisochrysis_lutea.AAC.1
MSSLHCKPCITRTATTFPTDPADPHPFLLTSLPQFVKALAGVRSLAQLSSLLAGTSHPLDMQAVTAIGSCLVKLTQPHAGASTAATSAPQRRDSPESSSNPTSTAPLPSPPWTPHPSSAMATSATPDTLKASETLHPPSGISQPSPSMTLHPPSGISQPSPSVTLYPPQPEPLPRLHAFAHRVWQPLLAAQLPSRDAVGLSMCLQASAPHFNLVVHSVWHERTTWGFVG